MRDNTAYHPRWCHPTRRPPPHLCIIRHVIAKSAFVPTLHDKMLHHANITQPKNSKSPRIQIFVKKTMKTVISFIFHSFPSRDCACKLCPENYRSSSLPPGHQNLASCSANHHPTCQLLSRAAKNTGIYSIASKPYVFPVFSLNYTCRTKNRTNSVYNPEKIHPNHRCFAHFRKKTRLPQVKTHWVNMETPTLVALNVAPLNAPHIELEWLPLANRDF